MENSKSIFGLIGLAVLSGITGSVLGASLFWIYSISAFYWELHQQFGDHMFDMGVTLPSMSTVFTFSAIFSLPFTLASTIIIGVPLVHRFKKSLFLYPKTSMFAFTFLGSLLAVAIVTLLFKNANTTVMVASPFFGGATAFAYSVAVLCFRRSATA